MRGEGCAVREHFLNFYWPANTIATSKATGAGEDRPASGLPPAASRRASDCRPAGETAIISRALLWAVQAGSGASAAGAGSDLENKRLTISFRPESAADAFGQTSPRTPPVKGRGHEQVSDRIHRHLFFDPDRLPDRAGQSLRGSDRYRLLADGHGLHGRTHFRRALQSGRVAGRAVARQALGRRFHPLSDRPVRRRRGGRLGCQLHPGRLSGGRCRRRRSRRLA